MINYLKKPLTINDYSDFNDRIASITKFHDDTTVDLSFFDVALLGFEEDKEQNTSDIIRKYFFELYKYDNLNIIDLGNIDNNESNILDIFQRLNNVNVKLVFLGNAILLNAPFLRYFQEKSYLFSLINIDSKIDFQIDLINSSYENIYQVGYQKYLVNPNNIEKLRKNGFSLYRLSEIVADINEFEPIFRISEIANLNISAVKAADAPASINSSPNGFTANEICRLAFFAGLSDKIKLFNIYGVNTDYDINKITSKLVAQIIWHFLDALSLKQNVKNNLENNYRVFYVKQFEDSFEQDLKFFHCQNTNRWWFAVTDSKIEKLLPCSFKDYEAAKTKKITKRIKTYLSKK